MLRYLVEIDGIDHVALAALVFDDAGELAGVARFVRAQDDPARAEVAFVMADGFEGGELGQALGLLLADAASARGIEHVTSRTAGDDPAAGRLLHRLADHLERGGDAAGTRELVADLAA